MDADFFLQPKISPHKKYEALRASYVDGLSDEDVAEKFGFTYFSFKSIKRDLKRAVDTDFFIPPAPRGKSQNRSQYSFRRTGYGIGTAGTQICSLRRRL